MERYKERIARSANREIHQRLPENKKAANAAFSIEAVISRLDTALEREGSPLLEEPGQHLSLARDLHGLQR